MPIELRRVQAHEIAGVHALLADHGWAGRLGDLPQFTALIAASQIAEVAVSDGKVVGFVRGITDARSNGYLSMVVVQAQQRRSGIGRALVEHAMGRNPKVTWVLRAGRPGASEFFAKLGFVPSVEAMERRRAEP